MHAITLAEPGGPEVLRWTEVDDPVAGEGQVVIDVVASGVNRADLLQRMGRYPPPTGAPPWPGLECSGRISAVGEGVTTWHVGDEVCALLGGGSYAERVAVDARHVAGAPRGLDLVEAAALPEVACTVWSNVVMLAHLSAGEFLLVHGGSSGIGTFAIQLAVVLGARVACTAGTEEKLRRCSELGADVVINYREDDFVARVREVTDGRGADVVLDNMGGSYLPRNVEVLATGGRLVTIGMQGGRKGELDLGTLLAKRASVHATSLRARPADEKAAIVEAVVADVWPLVESGRVRPVVDRRVPMPEAAEAHRVMEASEHVGKILLVVP